MTARGWIADQLKLVVLLLALAVLVIFAVGGAPFLRGLMIENFGFRPIGAADTAMQSAYLAVALPVCFLVWMVAMAAALWTYRSWRWFTAQLVVSVVVAGGAGYAWFRQVMAPGLDARQHLSNWPTNLHLTRFQVCAVEVEERPHETVAPVGRIAIEVSNGSRALLKEARFTVRVGSEWHRLAVQNLRPGERRRVERRAPLGVIEAELTGKFSGWTQRGAWVWWDSVRFEGSEHPAVGPRPDIADVHPIPDCPRFDLSGVWRSGDGKELRLSQRGNRPRGYLLPGGREVSGSFDGETFAGEGFRLKYVEGRLEGGLGRFERVGEGPPAARRR